MSDITVFIAYKATADIETDDGIEASDESIMQSIIGAVAAGEYDIRDSGLLFTAMKFFELIAHGDMSIVDAETLACAGSYVLQRFAYGDDFNPENYDEIVSAADGVS